MLIVPNKDIEKRIGKTPYVVYGVRKKMHDVAIFGKCRIFRNGYETPLLENPTWLDVACYADEMIRETGDEVHRYFEGVKVLGYEKDVRFYSFEMGS